MSQRGIAASLVVMLIVATWCFFFYHKGFGIFIEAVIIFVILLDLVLEKLETKPRRH